MVLRRMREEIEIANAVKEKPIYLEDITPNIIPHTLQLIVFMYKKCHPKTNILASKFEDCILSQLFKNLDSSYNSI